MHMALLRPACARIASAACDLSMPWCACDCVTVRVRPAGMLRLLVQAALLAQADAPSSRSPAAAAAAAAGTPAVLNLSPLPHSTFAGRRRAGHCALDNGWVIALPQDAAAVDIWRADVDHADHTLPWMLGVLEKFKSGTVKTDEDVQLDLKSDDDDAGQPPRPLQEAYPVFFNVGGGTKAVAQLLPGGSVDVTQYGIKPPNFTHTGGFGAWPTISQDGTIAFGGVPQCTNMTHFLEILTVSIEAQMPDPDFAGLGVFDFESWSPVWEENTQPPLPPSTAGNDPGYRSDRYRNLSRQLVIKDHPSWTAAQVEAQAKADFENAGLHMYVTALKHALTVRPNVAFGFYGYPGSAADTDRQRARLLPVWQASGALFPSIYETDSTETAACRLSRINQTVAVAVLAAEAAAAGETKRIPVYPFAWECYHNGSTLLTPADLEIEMTKPYNAGADGLVIWGSMSSKCQLEAGNCGGGVRVAELEDENDVVEHADVFELTQPVVLHEIDCCTQCDRSWCGAAVTFAFDALHIKGNSLCGGTNTSAACAKCPLACNVSVYRTSTGARYAAFDDSAPACPKTPPPPPPSKYFDYIKTHTGPLIEAFEKRVQLCSQNNCHGHGRCNVIDNKTLAGDGCACFDGYSGQTCALQLPQAELIQSAASKPAQRRGYRGAEFEPMKADRGPPDNQKPRAANLYPCPSCCDHKWEYEFSMWHPTGLIGAAAIAGCWNETGPGCRISDSASGSECLDATKDEVFFSACQGTNNGGGIAGQHFLFRNSSDNSTMMIRTADGTRCLSWCAGSLQDAAGTQVVAQRCEASEDGQHWKLSTAAVPEDSGHTLLTPYGHCVHFAPYAEGNLRYEAPPAVGAWSCVEEDPALSFSPAGVAEGAQQLVWNQDPARCVAAVSAGGDVTLPPCDPAAPNQQWTFNNTRISNADGRCLTMSTPCQDCNHSTVSAADCAATPTQNEQWSITEAGAVTSATGRLCLGANPALQIENLTVLASPSVEVGRAARSWFFFPDKLAVFPPHWKHSGVDERSGRSGRAEWTDESALLLGVTTSSDDFHDQGWTGRHFASFDSGFSWTEVENGGAAHEAWRDAHMCLPFNASIQHPALLCTPFTTKCRPEDAPCKAASTAYANGTVFQHDIAAGTVTPVDSTLVAYALGNRFNFTPPNTSAPCGNNPKCCGCSFITNHTCAGPINGTCDMPHHQPTDDRGFYSLGGSSSGRIRLLFDGCGGYAQLADFSPSLPTPVHGATLLWSADGLSWAALGSIPPGRCNGVGEGDFDYLPDGKTLYAILRNSGPKGTLCESFSVDNGRTWTTAVETDIRPGVSTVSPRLATLPNGLMVISSGRVGLFAWVSQDSAKSWVPFNLAVHHNLHVSEPAQRYSQAFVRGGGDTVLSTSYTSMVLLSGDTVLICYDRLGNGWDPAPGPYGDYTAVYCTRVTFRRSSQDRDVTRSEDAFVLKSDDNDVGTIDAYLTHSMQKILQTATPPPPLAGTVLELVAARNEYEPLLVVLKGPATYTAVSAVVPSTAIQYRANRVGYVSVVNISDCDSLGPGSFPDPLIPDVDSYVGQTRNAFPVSVPEGENRLLLIDLFIPPGTSPGSHTGSVTLTTAKNATKALPFKLQVFGLTLPSTASMQSRYGMGQGQIYKGHHLSASGDSAAQRALYTRYLEAGLMHRISGADDRKNYSLIIDLIENDGSFVNATGRTLPFGLSGAKLTSIQMPCSTIGPEPYKSAGCPVFAATNKSWVNASTAWTAAVKKYWAAVLTNFSRHNDGRDSLLYDYSLDEPTGAKAPLCVIYHSNATGHSARNCTVAYQLIKARAAALHAVDPSLRSLVTTEFCGQGGNINGTCNVPMGLSEVKDDINLFVPMVQYVAGREKPRYPNGTWPCSDVPTGSQRHTYDFVTAGGKKNNDLWWYQACFSEGGCAAGPQRACTLKEKHEGLPGSDPCLEGWPSFMIDHSAIRNRMLQWATFRYDVHGELLWSAVYGYHNPGGHNCNGTDGWVGARTQDYLSHF